MTDLVSFLNILAVAEVLKQSQVDLCLFVGWFVGWWACRADRGAAKVVWPLESSRTGEEISGSLPKVWKCLLSTGAVSCSGSWEPHKHRAKSKLIFLAEVGSWKQHLGRGSVRSNPCCWFTPELLFPRVILSWSNFPSSSPVFHFLKMAVARVSLP